MKNRIIPFLATFFGSICFGLLFIVVFVNATQVNCIKQPAGTYTCQLRTLFLGRFPIFNRIVQNVTGINMAEDDGEHGPSYRAEFATTDGGSVPLDTTWTDYDPVSKQVTAISSQMASDADQVQYTANPPWWVLFLMVGLMIMMVLLSPLFFLRR
jgi:hypothetical protein